MRDQLRGQPHLRHVLGMAQQELHMKTNLSGLTQSKTGGSVGATPLEEMRPRWLNELRALAYTMVGAAASQGALYVVPGAAAAASQGARAAAPSASLWQTAQQPHHHHHHHHHGERSPAGGAPPPARAARPLLREAARAPM